MGVWAPARWEDVLGAAAKALAKMKDVVEYYVLRDKVKAEDELEENDFLHPDSEYREKGDEGRGEGVGDERYDRQRRLGRAGVQGDVHVNLRRY